MIIYNAAHPGIKLDNQVLRLLKLDSETTKGYLSRNDLERLLSQSDCVGLRIYNTCFLDTSTNPNTEHTDTGIVAVGVKLNGFELDGLYMRSHRPDSNLHNGAGIQTDKNGADSVVNGVLGEPIEFYASFMSATMLNTLLADTNFDGLTFYAFQMKDPNQQQGNLPIDIKLSTHVAIPSKPNSDGTLDFSEPDPTVNNVYSDQPCPGHCVELDPNGGGDTSGDTLDDLIITPGTAFEEPYLFPWAP